MKHDVDELSEQDQRRAYEELTIPTGEFVALFASALMLLALFFGTATLSGAAKAVAADVAATFSRASAQIRTVGTHLEARASEQNTISEKLHQCRSMLVADRLT
jgi:hypothetical protein